MPESVYLWMQATYAPDGGYIPRVLFAEPGGKLRADIRNPGAGDKYTYFYTSVDQVLSPVQLISLLALALLGFSWQGAVSVSAMMQWQCLRR